MSGDAARTSACATVFIKLRLLVAGLGWSVCAPAAVNSVTYHGQIEPIVLQDCAPCHRPGESGPFSLLTYEDVKKRAAQIVKVTGSRFMPPWLPEAGYGQFKEERRLTDAQIKLFAEWVKQGTPAGTRGKSAAVPQSDAAWPLGPPDLALPSPRPSPVHAHARQ